MYGSWANGRLSVCFPVSVCNGRPRLSLLTLRAVVSPSLQGLRVSNRYKILRVKMQVCVLTFVGTNYSLN